MKKIALLLIAIGFSMASTLAHAGPEDCADNEQWNEETEACELIND